MTNRKKTILILLSGAFVLALAAGAAALAYPTVASAASSLRSQNRIFPTVAQFAPNGNRPGMAHESGMPGDLAHRGGSGLAPKDGGADPYLAEALDISVEELQAVYEAAWQAAIDQALDQEMITENQAEKMKEWGGFGFMRKGFPRGGMPGLAGDIDFNSLLAKELDISVEELHDARQVATEAALQQALEDGKLSQEEFELKKAHLALQEYLADTDHLEHEDLLLEALGISQEDLDAALEDGKTMRELMDELGITSEQIQAAMQEMADARQATYEAAVQKALDDGAITAEQAEALLDAEAGFGFRGKRGFPGGGFPGKDFPREGFPGGECFPGRGHPNGHWQNSPDDDGTHWRPEGFDNEAPGIDV